MLKSVNYLVRENLAFWTFFARSVNSTERAEPTMTAANDGSVEEKMMKNVEIKARVRDPEKLEGIVYDLTESLGMVLAQEDVFFRVPAGRLKLRVHDHGNVCELFVHL